MWSERNCLSFETAIYEIETLSPRLTVRRSAGLLTSLQQQGIEYEVDLHQQFEDNPPTQRKQQDQHQERSTTGRYYIAQAVYGSTRKRIFRRLTWVARGLKIDGGYLRHFRFADDILICANALHITYRDRKQTSG